MKVPFKALAPALEAFLAERRAMRTQGVRLPAEWVEQVAEIEADLAAFGKKSPTMPF